MVPTLSPLVTFLGAILGLSAIALIPGKTQIKKGKTEQFTSWGKIAITILAIILFVLAAAVLYYWPTTGADQGFALGNVLLFLGLGIGLVVNNFFVSGKIAKVQTEKEIAEVHEVETLGPGVVTTPATGAAPKKAGPKTGTKPFKPEVAPAVGKPLPSPKVPKKAKVPKLIAPPHPVASEELIEPAAGPKKCPSCDTPLDHNTDKTCPVCGHDLNS